MVLVLTLTKTLSAIGIQCPVPFGAVLTSVLPRLFGRPDMMALSRSLRVFIRISTRSAQPLQGYSVPLSMNFLGVEFVKSKSSLRLCSLLSFFSCT